VTIFHNLINLNQINNSDMLLGFYQCYIYHCS